MALLHVYTTENKTNESLDANMQHRESGGSTVRLSVSPDVCFQGVQTDSDGIFSEARFLFDDSKVHCCTGLPVVKC